MRRVGPTARPSKGLAVLVSCGFTALTLDCRFCGPGFGWSSGEAEQRAVPRVGGSGPLAETLSAAAPDPAEGSSSHRDSSTSRRPLNESPDGDRFEGLQPTEARQQSATPARPAAPEVGVQEQSLRYL